MKSGPLQILLIEDNPGDARLVKEALSEINSPVEMTHSVRLQEGLRRAAEKRFDVLLLDLSLPDASGLDTVRQADKALPEVPIIVLTGFNDEAFSISVVHEGAQDFLAKGQFDGALLMRSIRYAIERKQSQKDLKASREFALNIIDSSLDMIIAINRDGNILEFNKAAQKTFGYSPEEILSKPSRLLFAEVAENTRVTETILKEGKFVGQITGRRKNGAHFPTAFSASMLKNERGEFQGIVAISRDITDQLNLESQLRHAQKMDSIGHLAAGVAHDFNNILTVIQGYATLLLSRRALMPEISEPLNEISVASEHAASLTRQLLTFSRKQTIQPRSLELDAVIRNVSKMLTRLLGEDITLRVESSPGLPSICADPGMLEQVIINLAVNARDAMPRGGEIRIASASVTMTADDVKQHPQARAGKFVCLSVSDNGKGMPPEMLNRIFEPFFTTKEPGKGTGLGLATVYGIVQSHQGWIEVNSAAEKGTTFQIYFPTADALTVQKSEELNEGQCHGTETVFVVEDVSELRHLVRQILEAFGYKVFEAANGVEALSIWKQHNAEIDLLLTDVVMPEGISGRDLAEKLLADKQSLRVIYTSGHSIDLVGGDLNLREGKNFLQKPYQAITLARTIRACLDSKIES
jgi:PAS domain S-box-containing protein